ncbi:pyridoxamine 5'-phosphate oxidase family protein [Antrihabitans stalactiti]|uniref:Pyridoxamine 5'-phosphate oxidase family protein n=1 Tax=Antrihabitans stalactiti TaxID=2584121 RepID=A0A848KBP1_9NOCA|nr:pyridoxamine 5'-phosphate oxidase family protein [Antrihabitans stalactiti]NMN94938.1 pyridoxamine 5'-phosphate oxidase family protein [Antrihabitans stalactiti]
MVAEIFHAGERYVQDRLGQADIAQRVGRGIGRQIPYAAAEFLAEQPLVVIGARDAEGCVWASPLIGAPGFVRVVDYDVIEIDVELTTGERLADALRGRVSIGLIALEPETRRRMRVNGVSEPTERGIRITAEQVYSNCPKYISRRPLDVGGPGHTGPTFRQGLELDPQQQDTIRAAETFFIATTDRDGNADASHRGGNAGFLQVLSPTRLRWPDYRGNSMFMTLGNIMVNPAAGLWVPDRATGASLSISGNAELNWDYGDEPGAQLLIDFTVTDVVQRP